MIGWVLTLWVTLRRQVGDLVVQPGVVDVVAERVAGDPARRRGRPGGAGLPRRDDIGRVGRQVDAAVRRDGRRREDLLDRAGAAGAFERVAVRLGHRVADRASGSPRRTPAPAADQVDPPFGRLAVDRDRVAVAGIAAEPVGAGRLAAVVRRAGVLDLGRPGRVEVAVRRGRRGREAVDAEGGVLERRRCRSAREIATGLLNVAPPSVDLTTYVLLSDARRVAPSQKTYRVAVRPDDRSRALAVQDVAGDRLRAR